MNQQMQKNGYIPAKILAVSCVVVFLSFVWQGNKGFNLWDEGFLWYGIQRVLLGEVPILDFMSYDPGRYYWSAFLLGMFGDSSIMGVRAAAAVFQVLGLFVGLLLIAWAEKKETKSSAFFWILAAAILVLWMLPRHKLFDISLSIMLIGALTFLINNPVRRRYFFTGACVGLVAVFGRNHGMYGALASLGVIAWLNIKRGYSAGLNGILIWSAGLVVGFLPIVFMALLIPGFAVAFWESIRFLFEQKATNLPLPVPWPWTVNFAATSFGEAARGGLIGIFFLGVLLFGGLAVAWVVYRRLKEKPVAPALVASAFLAIPYTHYAFSRADVGHLAQGIFPLLVGSLVILSMAQVRIKWLCTIGLCAASFWTTHVFHPGWQCLASEQCVSVHVSDNELRVDPGTASDIALLRQLTKQYAQNGQQFIATPFWPGAYALLERKSPMWEIYALFPRSEIFQRKEIERIKASRPAYAIIYNVPLDGREELRFKNTHPLIYAYILEIFEPSAGSQNPAYEIYRARDKQQ